MFKEYSYAIKLAIGILFCTTCFATASAYKWFMSEQKNGFVLNFIVLFLIGALLAIAILLCTIYRDKKLKQKMSRYRSLTIKLIYRSFYVLCLACYGVLAQKFMYLRPNEISDFPAIRQYLIIMMVIWGIICIITIIRERHRICMPKDEGI